MARSSNGPQQDSESVPKALVRTPDPRHAASLDRFMGSSGGPCRTPEAAAESHVPPSGDRDSNRLAGATAPRSDDPAHDPHAATGASGSACDGREVDPLACFSAEGDLRAEPRGAADVDTLAAFADETDRGTAIVLSRDVIGPPGSLAPHTFEAPAGSTACHRESFSDQADRSELPSGRAAPASTAPITIDTAPTTSTAATRCLRRSARIARVGIVALTAVAAGVAIGLPQRFVSHDRTRTSSARPPGPPSVSPAPRVEERMLDRQRGSVATGATARDTDTGSATSAGSLRMSSAPRVGERTPDRQRGPAATGTTARDTDTGSATSAASPRVFSAPRGEERTPDRQRGSVAIGTTAREMDMGSAAEVRTTGKPSSEPQVSMARPGRGAPEETLRPAVQLAPSVSHEADAEWRERRATPPVAAPAAAAGTAGLAEREPIAAFAAPPSIAPRAAFGMPLTTIAAVESILGQYAHAFTALDVHGVRTIWPTVDIRALDRAFGGLVRQRLDLGSCDIALEGAAATASCSGVAEYVPKVGARRARTQPRVWTFVLGRGGMGEWTIRSVHAR